MKYERELQSVIEWVKKNPGLSAAAHTEKLKDLPWDGRPASGSLLWKLRYLELAGVVECRHGGNDKNAWYAKV